MSMAVHCTRSGSPAIESSLAAAAAAGGGLINVRPRLTAVCFRNGTTKGRVLNLRVSALDRGGGKSGGGGDRSSTSSKVSSSSTSASSVPNSNYVVPLDKSSCITRPLGEILRDLNKRIPDQVVKSTPYHDQDTLIPWYHANRMLSFYAPGWCGEIRDVIFSDSGSVTVVYRVTIRGSDAEAHRESTGTVSSDGGHDPVAAAEEIAFCKACAKFGLGLYLYHDE